MIKVAKYISNNPEDTYNLGIKLAQAFSGGEVIALYGDLGAGKTALTQGIAAGLGVKEKVNSPTFNIIKVYQTKFKNIKQLCHVDAYRLRDLQDLINIGIDEYLGKKDTLTVIEWAERVEGLVEKKVITIRIEYFGNKRIIKIQKK